MAEKNDGVTDEFEKALGRLRQERLSGLTDAARVHEAMHALLQHEALRIERKLGAEHTRTKKLTAGLQATGKVANALKREGELLRINVPETPEKGALIHGRIVDETGLGIEGLTVALVDRSGAPARDVSEPTTDASGYFAIPLEPEAVDRLIKGHADGIFLAVLAPRRRPVYQQPKPLALARGARLLVQEVRLKRADLISIPSPPAPTVAVPKLVGLTLEKAKGKVTDAGLKIGAVSGPSPADDSIVAKQKPLREAKVPLDTPVHLTVRPPRAARGSGKRPRRSPRPLPQDTGD